MQISWQSAIVPTRPFQNGSDQHHFPLSLGFLAGTSSGLTSAIRVRAVSQNGTTWFFLFTSSIPASEGHNSLSLHLLFTEPAPSKPITAPSWNKSQCIVSPGEDSTSCVTAFQFSSSFITWIVGAWGRVTPRTSNTLEGPSGNSS